MSKWKITTLGAIASIKTGPFGSQLHQSDYTKSGVGVIMPQNIGDRTVSFEKIAFISKEEAERLKRYKVQKNDIVFSRRGDVEKHAFINETLSGTICGTGCFRVRVNNQNIWPEFISHYLNRPESKQWLTQHAVGSNMLNLNTEILSEVPINHPDFKTQKEISELLSRLDCKISLNNAINAELEKAAKLLYDYWFVQFDFPNTEGKPYRASGGEMVYNEQLKRKIPKGWKSHKLSKTSLCTIMSSGIEKFDGKKIYLSTSEVDGSEIINHAVMTDYANRLSRANMQPRMNSVWFAKMKDTVKNILVNEGAEILVSDYIFSTGFAGLQCTQTSLYYVWNYLRGDYFEKKKNLVATGATQQAINDDDLKGFDIIVPPDTLLSQFHNIVAPYYHLISKKKFENIELITLRDFLLPLLMNGQVTMVDINTI